MLRWSADILVISTGLFLGQVRTSHHSQMPIIASHRSNRPTLSKSLIPQLHAPTSVMRRSRADNYFLRGPQPIEVTPQARFWTDVLGLHHERPPSATSSINVRLNYDEPGELQLTWPSEPPSMEATSYLKEKHTEDSMTGEQTKEQKPAAASATYRSATSYAWVNPANKQTVPAQSETTWHLTGPHVW